jgi:hypothetical protein
MTHEEELQEQARARDLVRRVYSTPDGLKVLTALLLDLGLFSKATDADSMARRNFAIFYIRERLGFTQAQDAEELVKLLLQLGK